MTQSEYQELVVKKPKVKVEKVVVITDSTPRHSDEMFCRWFTCSNPKCGCSQIADGFKYCPDCGWKVRW